MIGQTISHYKIIEKLGEGGMGVVYKAHDTKLDRDVALKFLPHHLTTTTDEQARFLQEARAASALNHPNICGIHSIGGEGDRQFIEMEYVDGRTLRQLIPIQKTQTVIDYAIQIGEALQEAHSNGIVHRDVKAENIMVNSKNRIKVMDFGLAKLKGSLKLTKTSSTVGTLAYMAPEQIQGGEVDARSDIFSFGVLLFEMLTGRLPFRGEHEAAMVYSIVNEEPERLQRYLPDAPPELQHLLDDALEKIPEDRYQTIGEVVHELRRIKKHTSKVHRPTRPTTVPGVEEEIDTAADRPPTASPGKIPRRPILFGVGIVVMAIVCAGLYFLFFGIKKPIDSIAILPFINVNADSTVEYLSDGITENLINSVTQLSNLRVIPRSTAFHYKGKDVDPREVGNTLKVRSLLTGRVIQRGSDLNIQLDLIDIATESQIWGMQYRKSLSDIAAVQEEMVKGLCQKLQPGLSGEEKTKVSRGLTTNAEAFQLYLKGRFFLNKRTPAGMDTSVGYFERAIEKDPAYALAYAGLADAHILLAEWGIRPTKEAFPKAKAAALKALEIDNESGEAHTSLAVVLREFEWDWAGAEREHIRAIQLNPRYSTGHQWYAEHLSFSGRHQEALAEILRAQELDPLSLIINSVIGFVYLNARQYDRALEQCRRVFQMDSSFALAQNYFVATMEEKGMSDLELAEVNRVQERSGINRAWIQSYNRAYKSGGSKGLARFYLAQLDAVSKNEYVPNYYYSYAWYYATLGEKEKALQALEKSIREREYYLVQLKVIPDFDILRSDPRFKAVLKTVGLEE